DQQVDGVAVHGKRAHDETSSAGGECDIHYPRFGRCLCQGMLLLMLLLLLLLPPSSCRWD
ncbi:hypothetical protein, partial [Shewanella algae]|uniref:hypothetical protein n=1 Tax=Shewanella algae TaxID=38313 RepID=UPI00313CEDCE